MKQPKPYLLLMIIVFSFQLSLYSQANHQVKYVVGSTGNQLEVLDWGGKGVAILFLTGLGNSAHVYDDFAPRFTSGFHVYGLSRRGFGNSKQTVNGYGVDTLAKDILAVMEALRLKQVILIGHSIAGDELTEFATQYPEKVRKVIYFDAAYDRTSIDKLPFPSFPPTRKEDTTSISYYNSYLKRTRGFVFPEDELREQSILSPDGALVADKTPGWIYEAILQGIRVPNYKAIKCPALAIYGQRSTAQQWFPSYPYMDSTNQQKAVDIFMPAWQTYYNAEMTRFKTEKPDGIIKEIPGADHYVFLTHPNETESLIRAFLQ